jgi:formyltetrahydrofolate synthetase
LWSCYEVVANRLQSDFESDIKAIAELLQVVAKRSQTNELLQSGSKSIAKLLRSDHISITKRLQSACKRLQSNNEVIINRLQCASEAIAYDCRALIKWL